MSEIDGKVQAGQDINGWVLIPPFVMALDISANAKFLYGRILATVGEDGFCRASNNYLARGCGIDPRTVQRGIRLLEEKGLLKTEYKEVDQNLTLRRISISVTPHGILSPPMTAVSPTKYIDTKKTKTLSLEELDIIQKNSSETFSPSLPLKPTNASSSDSPSGNMGNEQEKSSKTSLHPLTPLEAWELAKKLDVRLRVVQQTEENFWQYIEDPKNRKKYKTSYFTIMKWIKMGIQKGQIETCNETERMELAMDHPDKVAEKESLLKWARERKIIE